jgi:hypothetical protein
MPLARYFSIVGGVLLALLVILDAYFPALPVAAKPKVYLPVIRIYTDRKWPERIVYDTNLATIVPASIARTDADAILHTAEMIVDASAAARELEAFAMLSSSVDRMQGASTKVQEHKPRHYRKVTRKRVPAPRIAMARHLQFGWFSRSFW